VCGVCAYECESLSVCTFVCVNLVSTRGYFLFFTTQVQGLTVCGVVVCDLRCGVCVCVCGWRVACGVVCGVWCGV